MEKTILKKVLSLFGRKKRIDPISEAEIYLERKRKIWEESLKYVEGLSESKPQ